MSRGQAPKKGRGERALSLGLQGTCFTLVTDGVESRALPGKLSSPKRYPVSKQGAAIKAIVFLFVCVVVVMVEVVVLVSSYCLS